jgi:hypothetical protein
MFTNFWLGESNDVNFDRAVEWTRVVSGATPETTDRRPVPPEKLFLKTRARLVAGIFVDGLVVRADNRLRAVAPEMAGRDVFAVLIGKGFLGGEAGEHFFRAEMFAESLHATPFNLSSVRRISACAIGTL